MSDPALSRPTARPTARPTPVPPDAAVPQVSVIVPVHDTREHLGAALASLQAQTMSAWEALVIDDASTDGSAQVAEAWARRDPRCRVLRRCERGGVSAARNDGLDAARGRWIAFLDSDDLLEPQALETLLRAARASHLPAAFGAYHVCGADAMPLYTYVDTRSTVEFDDLIDRAYLCTGTHIVSRSHFEADRVGARRFGARRFGAKQVDAIRFDPSLRGYEDRDVWFRLAERGVRWSCVDVPVSRYRIRPGSASKDAGVMLRDAQRVYVAMWSRALDADPARSSRLTPARLDRCLDRLALAYASRAAVVDEAGGVDAAIELWAGSGRRGPLDAGRLARAGQFAVIYGRGVWPDFDAARPASWAVRLRAFWRALERENDLPDRGAEGAWSRLGVPLEHAVRGVPTTMLSAMEVT